MEKARSNGSKGKRVVFKEKGVVAVEEFALQQPEPEQVLVRAVSTLISPGTETAFLMALPNTSGRFPMYPGYSNAGVAVALGSGVSEFVAGNRVVSRAGHASHSTLREDELMRIPDGISFDEASFFSLGSIALQGIRKADIELGESIVVLGQGLVGNLALQLAKLSGGLPVIGVDMYKYRLEIARKSGADHVINPLEDDIRETVKNITDGKGAGVVVEASGNPDAIATALELIGAYGRVVILGSPRGTTEVNFYSAVHRKGAHVIGAHDSTRPLYESSRGWWTKRDDSLLVLRLIDKGLLRVKDLVTARLSFLEAEEAYKRLIGSKDKTLGVVLDWENA